MYGAAEADRPVLKLPVYCGLNKVLTERTIIMPLLRTTLNSKPVSRGQGPVDILSILEQNVTFENYYCIFTTRRLFFNTYLPAI